VSNSGLADNEIDRLGQLYSQMLGDLPSYRESDLHHSLDVEAYQYKPQGIDPSNLSRVRNLATSPAKSPDFNTVDNNSPERWVKTLTNCFYVSEGSNTDHNNTITDAEAERIASVFRNAYRSCYDTSTLDSLIQQRLQNGKIKTWNYNKVMEYLERLN